MTKKVSFSEQLDRPLWTREVVKVFFCWQSDTPLYNAIHKRGFPEPLKVGRRSLWKREEVMAWADSRSRGLEAVPHLLKGRS